MTDIPSLNCLPFDLDLSMKTAGQIARIAVHQAPDDGVSLVVTPNIDHIAMILRSPALKQAYRNAAMIVCDGWPVHAYARWCGLPVARVTGCEIMRELVRLAPFARPHRMFFVVDGVGTRIAVEKWAARSGVAVDIAIPPHGFERDAEYCAYLTARISEHRTTLLIMAVGAPRSEVFVDTHRSALPPCWAFCVGQAVKIEFGLVRRAPSWVQSICLEWLWRMIQEPKRLSYRYATAVVGFGLAVLQDQLRHHRSGKR